jgi:sugar/nucleoside kinase (ribokinase family)
MRYVVIGHLCRDELTLSLDGQSADWRYGGTVLYSGLMAAKLGAEVHVLTRCQQAPTPDELASPLNWHCLASQLTTTFVNTYDSETGEREQRLLAQADPISTADIQRLPVQGDILHLGPVADEIIGSPEALPGGQTVATPQGWMRAVDETQTVQRKTWHAAEKWLPHLKMVVLSDEDVAGDIETARSFAAAGPTVLYTRGPNGAILFRGEEEINIRAVPSKEVDQTGAGDVTAAAFFIRWYETGDALEAAFFGVAAGSLVVEQDGTKGIPTREGLQARLADWPISDRIAR